MIKLKDYFKNRNLISLKTKFSLGGEKYQFREIAEQDEQHIYLFNIKTKAIMSINFISLNSGERKYGIICLERFKKLFDNNSFYTWKICSKNMFVINEEEIGIKKLTRFEMIDLE